MVPDPFPVSQKIQRIFLQNWNTLSCPFRPWVCPSHVLRLYCSDQRQNILPDVEILVVVLNFLRWVHQTGKVHPGTVALVKNFVSVTHPPSSVLALMEFWVSTWTTTSMSSKGFCQAAMTESKELDMEALCGGSENISNATESLPLISWKSSTLLFGRYIMKASLVVGLDYLLRYFIYSSSIRSCIQRLFY